MYKLVKQQKLFIINNFIFFLKLIINLNNVKLTMIFKPLLLNVIICKNVLLIFENRSTKSKACGSTNTQT